MSAALQSVDAAWFEPTDRCWCGGRSSTPSPHSADYRVCPRCGAHFAARRLKPGCIGKFYSYEGYWQHRQQGKQHPTLWQRRQLLEADGRVQCWIDRIERHTNGRRGTAVEAGCAEGTLLIALKALGWQTVGIEPDPQTAAAVREHTGLDVRSGVFPDVPAPPCDLFVACDVLEHVPDPLRFLQAAREALRPGGVLFLQLPLIEPHQPDFGDMTGKVFDPEEHVFIHSRASLAALLEAAEFEVLENDAAWRRAHEIAVARRIERPVRKVRHLANLPQMFSPEWTGFIDELNDFAAPLGLRQFENWSKLWEYPWLWHHGLSAIDWRGKRLLDLGSEQSPLPWWLATKGAQVTLVETRDNWIGQWEAVRAALPPRSAQTSWGAGLRPGRKPDNTEPVRQAHGPEPAEGVVPPNLAESGRANEILSHDGKPVGDAAPPPRPLPAVKVDWRIVDSCKLPFPNDSFDVVTSLSVIEHQDNKPLAAAEVARVLKPGGLFALSFDICEPSLGMTFPDWNGRALTMREFETIFWKHPAFGNRAPPKWNIEDIPPFLRWHRQTAPHHNYVTGAAVLRKQRNPGWRRFLPWT